MKKNTIFVETVINAIKALVGCQFIHMSYISEPDMNKSQKAAICALTNKNGEILPIEKITSGQFQVNYSYENAVNNRGAKEQGAPIDFVAASLRWGTWVVGQENKLIEHKGTIYLRYYGVQNGKVDNKYFVGGKPATDEQIALIKQFTEKKTSATQAAAGLTENQVVCRVVKIENILEITLNGTTLKNNSLAAKAA